MKHVFLKGKLKAKIRSLCLTINSSEKNTVVFSPQIPIKHDMDLDRVRHVTKKTMMHNSKREKQ